MIKIMGRTDGEISIRWADGVLAGIVGDKATQLMSVSQQIFTRHTPLGNGRYQAAYLEIVYFSDRLPGELLETMQRLKPSPCPLF